MKHPLKGKKKSAQAVANMRKAQQARWKKVKAIDGQRIKGVSAKHANGKLLLKADSHNARDASVYLRHAIARWPAEKKHGISKLYVELALATLEGKA